jgi:AbrB family looped-hinge helix DNA binding protein
MNTISIAKDIYIPRLLLLKRIVGERMEVAMTRISQNGQVVIPAEVRKDAGILPSTQFLVFNRDGDIILKRINKESLDKEFALINRINRGEKGIKEGKLVKASTDMNDDEIDALLIG